MKTAKLPTSTKVLICILLSLLLTACGIKGPLELPPDSEDKPEVEDDTSSN